MSDSSRSRAVTKARRHITTACHPCREDKIKCDGAVPECRQCSVKNRKCTYAGVDRRKLSLRKAVEAFSQRVRELESFIQAHGLGVPPSDPDDQATLDQLSSLYAPEPRELDAGDKKHPSQHSLSKPQTTPNADPAIPTAPTVDMTIDPQVPGVLDLIHVDSCSHDTSQAPETATGEPFVLNTPDFCMGTLPFNQAFDVDWVWNHSMVDYLENDIDLDGLQAPDHRVLDLLSESGHRSSPSDPSPPTLLIDEESTDDEDQSVVTNELSHRLGSLLMTENGERHFYGATSNLNLARGGTVPVLYANRSDKGKKAQARLEAVGIDEEISQELEERLIHLFFTWHNSSLYIVDQAIFTKARQDFEQGKQSTLFYSPFLMNAMCAVGAAFETNKYPALPFPLAEFFANRATTLLDLELQHPRISTVQALTILSTHEASCTRDTQGWLFSGMAMRLAIDFGLHVSTKAYVEAGSMSVEEARGRSVAFWGSFATDHMWGLYLGRPLHNISQAITVETPMAFSVHLDQDRPECFRHRGNDQQIGILDHQERFVEHWVQLPRIMSPLEGCLYFQVDASKLDLVKLGERTLAHLLSWRQNLPQELEVDLGDPGPDKCPPHVLILHMLYEYLIILLHRPFVAKRYIQPRPLVGKGPEHAREMCVNSASRISTLLSWYEGQHSLRQVNILVVQITFSAALVLVYATVSERDIENHRRLTGHLEMCCRTLAELGNVFNNAARTLDVLLHVKRTWQARLVVASAGSKRRAPSAAGSPTKRRTMSDVTRA